MQVLEVKDRGSNSKPPALSITAFSIFPGEMTGTSWQMRPPRAAGEAPARTGWLFINRTERFSCIRQG